jgi:large subunit ribosomal protein L10
MAKTKAQKNQVIEKGAKSLKESSNLIFADFGGTAAQDIRSLRISLREAGSRFEVIKKRLLNIILKNKGLDMDTKSFDGQVGTVFVTGEISDAAGRVFRFSKGKEKFKILGGVDLEKGEKLEADYVIRIGQLPSRDVLLGQVMGGMVAPLRAFMWILKERSGKLNEQK